MRYLAPGIALRPMSSQSWEVFERDSILAASTPLNQFLPVLDGPVSIVATGPTALDYPWDALQTNRRFIIAVNGATTMLKNLGLTPDLHVVTDRMFALTEMRHFEAAPDVPLAIDFLAAAALATSAPRVLAKRKFAILERVNTWFGLPVLDDKSLREMNERSGKPFLLPDKPQTKGYVGWSHRPELGVFSGRTVVYAALQLAVGAGAKDVEIIGMDLSGAGRAYDERGNPRPTQLQQHYQQFILPSFEMMHRALQGSQVKIRCLSPACPLPSRLFASISKQ
jgi:KDO transferase-3